LVVPGGNRSNLFTAKQYDDFELRLEFRLTAGANSGILIRTPRGSFQDVVAQGNEIQIYDDSAPAAIQPWQRHGSLYGVLAAKPGHLKPVGQWNSQTIRCQKNKLQVVLNGTIILDADLAELAKRPALNGSPHPGLRNDKGYIGLMNHTKRVEFRKIEIKELK
jgi:hypothetical protein